MFPIGDVGSHAEQHRAELLAQAEQERFARQAMAGRPRHDRFYCRTLIWFGRQLVRGGEWLQEYHGAIAAVRQLTATK